MGRGASLFTVAQTVARRWLINAMRSPGGIGPLFGSCVSSWVSLAGSLDCPCHLGSSMIQKPWLTELAGFV
jgi:hypothetical protein